MDKEMMNKVNEVLKANGRRELSMDEAAQVSGGAGECYSIYDIRTEDDAWYFVYTFVASMEKNFGKDVTYGFLKERYKRYR